jgi:hypothetical protein
MTAAPRGVTGRRVRARSGGTPRCGPADRRVGLAQRAALASALLLRAAGAGVCAEGQQPQQQPEQQQQQTAPLASAGSPARRAALWEEDLDALVDGLAAHHLNAFFRTSRTELAAAAADLRGRLPELEDHEVAVGFMRLAAMLGDGHTRAGGDAAPAPFRAYPIDLYWFSDGLFVIRAPSDRRDLLGWRLVRIGDVPVDEAVKRVSSVFAFENDSQLRQSVTRWLRCPEVLHATGVVTGPLRRRPGSQRRGVLR